MSPRRSAKRKFTPAEKEVRANYLGRYLGVERAYDTKLDKILNDCAASVYDKFSKLDDKNKIRRAQLALTQKEIRQTFKSVFAENEKMIRSSRQDAAMEAVRASLYTQKGLLARLLPKTHDREQYAKSLEQTAKRNIESVVIRVNETARPLAESVWKTRALANGLVDREINRALARGDSAEDLAKSVRNLIRPDVPGGVSYAAKRLGRTEINNAFHAQSIHDAQQYPWVKEMEWHLSKVHENDPGDLCEEYAGIQFFKIDKVPDKPHPNCRCYVTAKQMDYESFEKALIAGKFDSFIDNELKGSAIQARKPETVVPVEPEELLGKLVETGDATTDFANFELNRLGVRAFGFDLPNADQQAIRDTVSAFKEITQKYPQVPVTDFSFDYLEDDPESYAITYPRDVFRSNDGEWLGRISEIKFNERYLTELDFPPGGTYHPLGFDENPWRSTVFHEYGHAIQNYLSDDRIKPFEAEKALTEAFWKDNPGLADSVEYKKFFDIELQNKVRGRDIDSDIMEMFEDEAKFATKNHFYMDWLKERMSGYSFTDKDTIDTDEAVSDAFDEAERLGAKAREPAKVLHDLLIRKYKAKVKEVEKQAPEIARGLAQRAKL